MGVMARQHDLYRIGLTGFAARDVDGTLGPDEAGLRLRWRLLGHWDDVLCGVEVDTARMIEREAAA